MEYIVIWAMMTAIGSLMFVAGKSMKNAQVLSVSAAFMVTAIVTTLLSYSYYSSEASSGEAVAIIMALNAMTLPSSLIAMLSIFSALSVLSEIGKKKSIMKKLQSQSKNGKEREQQDV